MNLHNGGYNLFYQPLFKWRAQCLSSYIQGSKYINRERIEYDKWNQLHLFLDDSILKLKTSSESRLKYRATAEFELSHNKLYRQPDNRHLVSRYVVQESEAFDIIANEVFIRFPSKVNWMILQNPS